MAKEPDPIDKHAPTKGEFETVAPDEASESTDRAALVLKTGARPLPDYQLQSRLGKGGFGEVWKAHGPGGFDVALKFVPFEGQAARVELKSLELLKKLRHAHLVSMFGTWILHSHIVIAMELGDCTLHQLWQQYLQKGLQGIPFEELLGYMQEAAKGIDYLTDHNVHHKDIKPHNLLLVGESVKVTDFGLARVVEGSVASASGTMTPAYAAPELFNGKTTRWSDQYSFAISYCQMRGGRIPFEGVPAQVMMGHLSEPPDLTMLPEKERPAVEKALAKRPDARWPSCREFVAALTSSSTTAIEALQSPLPDVARAPAAEAAPPPPSATVLGIALTLGAGLLLVLAALSTRFPPGAMASWVSGDGMQESQPDFSLVPSCLLAGLVGGVLLAFQANLGQFLPARMRLTRSQASWLQSYQRAAFFGALILAGLQAGQFPVQWLLMGGLLLAAFTIALLAIQKAYPAILASVIGLGVAAGGVLMAGILLVVPAFQGINPIAAFNWYAAASAAGLLLAPPVYRFLSGQHGPRRALGMLALLCLVPVLAGALVQEGGFPGYSESDAYAVFREDILYLATVMFFLYVPVEYIAGKWSRAYLGNQGYGESATDWCLASFWLALLGSRVGMAVFVQSSGFAITTAAWLMLATTILAAMAIGNMASASEMVSPVSSLLMAGLFLGPIFPTLLGIVSHHFVGGPEHVIPRELGLCFAVMFVVGSLSGPMLVPAIEKYSTSQTIFRFPTVMALAAAVAALALCVTL